jgi:hypothetical protein
MFTPALVGSAIIPPARETLRIGGFAAAHALSAFLARGGVVLLGTTNEGESENRDGRSARHRSLRPAATTAAVTAFSAELIGDTAGTATWRDFPASSRYVQA